MEQGVLVVSLDYRNFPQGTVSDMVQDVTTGVWWVQQNIDKWGVRALSPRCSPCLVTVCYREWAWWTHTGGGSCLQIKPPPMDQLVPVEYHTVLCYTVRWLAGRVSP
jgi:hypothetical protein